MQRLQHEVLGVMGKAKPADTPQAQWTARKATRALQSRGNVPMNKACALLGDAMLHVAYRIVCLLLLLLLLALHRSSWALWSKMPAAVLLWR